MELGSLPRIPGHEIAGEVKELGPGAQGWKRGKGVTVAIDVVCRKCLHCRSGNTQRYPEKSRIGFERDGGHTEYVTVPEQNLLALPKSIGIEEASILPDAVACMYHSLMNQEALQPGQNVAILGAGDFGIHGIRSPS